MSDERKANADWRILSLPDGRYAWEAIHAALLMDLRDELQEIRESLGVLRCENFTRMPATLRRIAANTTKRTRSKPGKKRPR